MFGAVPGDHNLRSGGGGGGGGGGIGVGKSSGIPFRESAGGDGGKRGRGGGGGGWFCMVGLVQAKSSLTTHSFK
jgi:hypothetical protein